MTIHKSVLLEEAVEALGLKEGMTVVDATLGGGGHSKEILGKIGNSGKLIAFDWDREAIERFVEKITNGEFQISNEPNRISDKILSIGNVFLVNESFANIGEVLDSLKIKKIDAIVADLGISSDQLDDARRGLSFQQDAELDMRLDRSKELTAEFIINKYSEDDLKRIIFEYGDEKFAGRIANAIVRSRELMPIKSTKELVQAIVSAIPDKYRHGRIHPATKTFQALRIEVNGELDAIKAFIPQAIDLLAKGGRLAIISFHSGEDAIVKSIMREYARGCICPPELPICRCFNEAKIKLTTKKPIVPGTEEIESNVRSRSAKLRVAEKL